MPEGALWLHISHGASFLLRSSDTFKRIGENARPVELSSRTWALILFVALFVAGWFQTGDPPGLLLAVPISTLAARLG